MSFDVDGPVAAMVPFGRFRFRWHGWHFAAELEADEAGCRLRLDADLGPLPFTLEDRSRREALVALRGRRPIGRFDIDRHGHLHHYAEVELDAAPDAPALVTALVKLLLAARPAYDRTIPYSDVA